MESLAELEMKWGKCHKLHSYTVWTTPLVAPLLCVFLSLTLLSLIIISYYVHIFCLHLLFFASSLCLSFFIFCCNFLHNMTLSPYPNLLLMSLFHVYCQRLPSFNLYYLSLPSSLFISSCSLAFLTFIAPSPPPTDDVTLTLHTMNYWGETSTLLLPNKSQAFSVSSPLSLSPLYRLFCFLIFDLWPQIRSQVSESNMRFCFFPSIWS